MVMILLFVYFFHPRREEEIKAIENNFGLCKTTCLRDWQDAVWKGPFLHFPKVKSIHMASLWFEYKKLFNTRNRKDTFGFF